MGKSPEEIEEEYSQAFDEAVEISKIETKINKLKSFCPKSAEECINQEKRLAELKDELEKKNKRYSRSAPKKTPEALTKGLIEQGLPSGSFR